MARREKPRTLRKDRTGKNPVVVGLLVILGVVLVSWIGFTKDNPFSRGFQFKAVRPTFDLHPFRLNAQPSADGKTVRVWAQDHEGWLTMQGEVQLA